MLEPDEFEFYDLLEAYKDRFGEFPPTHHLPEALVARLIRQALESNSPIKESDLPQS